MNVGTIWRRRCHGQKLLLGLGSVGAAYFIDWPGEVARWFIVNLLEIWCGFNDKGVSAST